MSKSRKMAKLALAVALAAQVAQSMAGTAKAEAPQPLVEWSVDWTQDGRQVGYYYKLFPDGSIFKVGRTGYVYSWFVANRRANPSMNVSTYNRLIEDELMFDGTCGPIMKDGNCD